MSPKPERVRRLLKYVDKSKLGIEIAAYFNPAVPKAEGYNVRIIDVFDTARLRENAAKDPQIPDARIAEIEEVDIVGDASRIAELCEQAGLTGKVDYIVSSHNFEHLPNPIKFLQGVAAVLAPGGTISMAIPECRATFDHFRMQTRLVDWLQAYHQDYQQPTPETLFDHAAFNAHHLSEVDGEPRYSISFGMDNPKHFRVFGDLRAHYAKYLETKANPGDYRDAHCSVVSNVSFELLIVELQILGLLDLEIREITAPMGHEFMAHLVKPTEAKPFDEATLLARREALLLQNIRSLGNLWPETPPPPLNRKKATAAKLMLKSLVGKDRYTRVRNWNRRRQGKSTLS